MTEDIKDVKTLLERKYKEYNTEETDDYGDNLNWPELLVIEDIYVEIFGKEEFNEFLKRI